MDWIKRHTFGPRFRIYFWWRTRQVDRELEREWRRSDPEFVKAMEARDVPRMREMIARNLRVFMATQNGRRFLADQLRAKGFTEQQIADTAREFRPN